jgi:hypothetical protein
MAADRGNVFSRSVFVNCPFDSEYLPLLRPLLFTVIYVGFVPRIASEGSRRFGPQPLIRKKCLVLEKDQHEFQKAISDLSGIDIKHHNNEPSEVVRAVRNWFVETVSLRRVHSASRIWYRFTDFASDFYDKRIADGYSDADVHMMPVPEYIDFIRRWVRRGA